MIKNKSYAEASIGKEFASIILVSLPMVLHPVFSFVFLILVANNVSMEVYGALAFSIVFFSIMVSFSDCGLRDYLLSRDAIEKGRSEAANLFYPIVVIWSFLFFVLAPVMYYMGDALSFAIFLLYIPEAFAYGVISKSIFFAHQKNSSLRLFSRVDAYLKAVSFGLRICVFLFSQNILLSVAAGSVASVLLYSFWFFRELRSGGIVLRGKYVFPVLKDMLSIWKCWLPYSVSFVAFFLYFNSDRVVIEYFLGAQQLALYVAAYSFISFGQVAVRVLWSIYMPRVSKGDDVFGKKIFLVFSVVIGLSMFFLYQLLAWFFFGFFYPNEYDHSVVILAVLAIYFIFRIPNVVFEIYWVVEREYKNFTYIRVFAGVFNLSLNIMLVPVYGVVVAAITTILSEVMITFAMLVSEVKREKLWS